MHILINVFLCSNVIRLLETAKKLYIEAEKYFRTGDEEMAYVFYTKYFNLLNSIYKNSDYGASKPLIREMLGDNRSNKMTMDRLEDLTKSLNDRYIRLNAKLNAAASAHSPVSNVSTTLTTNDRSRSNSPKISNIDITSLRLMSCKQLFDSLKSQNILVMDCRSSEDYKLSHLQYVLTLNVPQELIQAG